MSDRPTVARPTPAAIRSFDTFGALFAFMMLIPNYVGSVAVADQIRLPQPACKLLEKFLRNSCVRLADVALSISQLIAPNVAARPDKLVEAARSQTGRESRNDCCCRPIGAAQWYRLCGV